MTRNFYKYQGTGNDFVILDNRDGAHNDLQPAQVSEMCHRRFGIGADGLMLLNTIDGYDFEMKYFNADGKESSMCGNGGRCLVQFANHIGLTKTSYHFLAIDGPHDATLDENGWVRLKMKNVSGITHHHKGHVVDTGSPHYVQLVKDVKNLDVFTAGKVIRNSDDFIAEGINVNFFEVQPTQIFVRTYERGVEDETLSCGTGVTACAIICNKNNDGLNKVNIATPGGKLLVEFAKTGKESFENIWLCGPATFVYKGEIDI